jgi:hypothetical protein
VFVARTWVGGITYLFGKRTFSSEIDVWGWGPENGEVFTVNSTYHFLDSMTYTGLQFSPTEEGVFAFYGRAKHL